MFRKIAIVSLNLTLLLALVGTLSVRQAREIPPAAPSHSTGPSIEQIRMLQHLVTTKVSLSDVMTTTIDGETGSMEVVLAVKGELSIGVNLADAQLTEVDEATRRAVLVLPQPTLLDFRIDHDRSRVAVIRSHGLWRALPGDAQVDARVIDAAYHQAQRRLQSSSVPADGHQRAMQQAQAVLGNLVRQLGWTMEFRWQCRSRGHGDHGTGG